MRPDDEIVLATQRPPPADDGAGVDRPRPRQLPSGSFRMQVASPLNPRQKLSITCPREEEVISKADIVRQMRRDLQFNLIAPEEVAKRLAVITGDAQPIVALKMRDVWEEYRLSFDPARQRALEGTWSLHFQKRFKDRGVLDVSGEDWDEWEKDHAQSGKGHIKTLWAMLRSAANRQTKKKPPRITAFPWSDWKPSGRIGRDAEKREPLRSIEEVQLLLTAARAHDERLRGWGLYSDAFIRVFAVTLSGLRQAEAAALGWDHARDVPAGSAPVMIFDIEFQTKAHWRDDHSEWDRPRYAPKNKHRRILRVHVTLRQAMLEHRDYLQAMGLYRPDGPVFPVPPKKGERYAEWRADEWVIKPELVREFAKKAGLPVDVERFDVHCLRHTMATLELAATADPVATARRTGHRNLEVFWQYVHTLGRGLPDSPIPAFRAPSPRVHAAALPAAEGWGDDAALLPEAPDVDAVDWDAAEELEDMRQATRDVVSVVGTSDTEEEFHDRVSDFEAAFRRWDAAGRKTKVPREVSERAKQAYTKAYNAKVRGGKGSPEERKKAAQLAGFRAKRAVLGAWGKLLARLGEAAPADLAGPVVHDAPAPSRGAVVLPFIRKGAPWQR